MSKRLMMLYYGGRIEKAHLYKDVGGVPFALAKWYGWKATLVYPDGDESVHDTDYEKEVKLMPYRAGRSSFVGALVFCWCHIQEYDVLGMFHPRIKTMLLTMLARFRNPRIKVYVKLDMGRFIFEDCLRKEKSILYRCIARVGEWLGGAADLYTVESKAYVEPLNGLRLFRGRVKYLPNGFFSMEGTTHQKITKENIILTVGRLGSPPKNTEMLLDAFAAIPVEIREGWQLILGGVYTKKIKAQVERLTEEDKTLEGEILLLGNIADKKLLASYYRRAMIFALPSRWEGFPLVLPEAMAGGAFPVVTDCCAAYNDVLDSGAHGDIVPNENVQAFAAALMGRMRDRQKTVALGEKAREFAYSSLTWEAIGGTLDKEFRRLQT